MVKTQKLINRRIQRNARKRALGVEALGECTGPKGATVLQSFDLFMPLQPSCEKANQQR